MSGETESFWRPGDDLDPWYRACRDHVTKRPIRQRVEQLWHSFQPYCADAHFQEELTRSFAARTWELYLAGWLLAWNFELVRPPPTGPDFHVVAPTPFWVEAVTAAPGQTAGLPRRIGNRITSVQEEPVLLRYTSAITTKAKRLSEYVEDGIVSSAQPLVIALNSAQVVDADLLDHEMPLVVKALFAIGEAYMAIAPYSDEPPRPGYFHRPEVTKPNQSSVPTTTFLDPQQAHVSGVLYSAQAIWNAPEEFGRDLVFVHNPMAKNPIPRQMLPVRTEYWIENDHLQRSDGRAHGPTSDDSDV